MFQNFSYIFCTKLIYLLLLNTCSAGTIDPNVPDEKYLDYAKNFPFVAKVTGNNTYYASAVVISPHFFLTNAHVADKINKIIIEETNEFEIIEIIIHENYKKESRENDIAIGKIKENFNLQFYPELYSEKNEINKVVCICGYGASGNFSTGKNKDDRKRRAGSNIISETTEYALFCSAIDNPKTQLEFLICHGDSGGGLFLDNKLCGLNCFIKQNDGTYNSNYSDKSGYIRISRHINWIKENIEKLR